MKRVAKHSANGGKDETFIEARFDASEDCRNKEMTEYGEGTSRVGVGARRGGRMAGQKTRTEEDKTKTYLHVTFCDVQRRNASVGETARKSTTQHALRVVANIVGDGAKIPEGQRVSRVIGRAVTRRHGRTNLASHFPEGARCAIGYYLEVVRGIIYKGLYGEA